MTTSLPRVHRALAWLALIAFISGVAPLIAERQRPLSPLPPEGQRVAPFFDGWYENPDGSFTLSFGYSNLNRDEVIEIPLGPNNVVEPKQFDGAQPTSFPPSPRAGDGGSTARRDRERGVFTVTVPAGFKGDVVWSLTNRGQTFKVPGRAKNSAYRLRWPMAMGSVPPLVRFKQNGPAGRGPVGIKADAVQTSVGKPIALTIWTIDDSVRDNDPISIRPRGASGDARPAINVNWFKHSGPGPVAFDPPQTPLAATEGTATTSATFKEPGSYVIRVRADNFGRVDTSPGNQCCWTNGYVRVTVTP